MKKILVFLLISLFSFSNAVFAAGNTDGEKKGDATADAFLGIPVDGFIIGFALLFMGFFFYIMIKDYLQNI